MATTTETKIQRLTRAANGGGILANQILGSVWALPHLARKAEMVQHRIERKAAGRTPVNTDAEYAQIIANQVGALYDAVSYNNPDAAYFARQDVVHAFRSGGLTAMVPAIQKYADRARSYADLAN